MEPPENTNSNNNTRQKLIGSAVRETLRESRNRRVVIMKRSGQKIIACSLLLALILSIGAPILPALVILGVWVETINVSLEKK